ncbi:MAG: ATP-binding cassette domain-containing protein [Parachlamydiaceae bacterium]
MNNIIQIENLTKNFTSGEKDLTALKDVTLSIEKGDVFGIIGLSGAGKSTLIRALAGLVIPTSGKIRFHGVDIVSMTKEERRFFRQKVGMVFQHFNLLTSRSVAENIAYPMEVANVPTEKQNQRVDELLGFVDLFEKKHEYISRLSGGQKQRVGIARALANRPEVLLCDEATSALDPKTTREILALLKGVNQKFGVTIILITHEMEVIKQICHKVAVMDQGKIVECGSVADVFADPQHLITKKLLHRTTDDIPRAFLRPSTATRKVLRLTFKGELADKPVISEVVKRFDVDVNILLGWIDRLQTYAIGTLVVELSGTPEGLRGALAYFQERVVRFEEIENGP